MNTRSISVEDVKKLTVSLPGTGPTSRKGTFRLVFQDRYLLLIAFLALVLNWVNSTGEYILGRTVEGAAQAAVAAGTAGGLSVPEYIGQFYSEFFFARRIWSGSRSSSSWCHGC